MIILTYVQNNETFQIKVRYVKPVSNVIGKECHNNMLCLMILRDNEQEYDTLHNVTKWSCMIADNRF